MRLTPRILAAWPRYRLTVDDRERADVARYCGLCPGEAATLDQLGANVTAAGDPLSWLECGDVLSGELRAGVVEALFAGLDVSGVSVKALARLVALEEHEGHLYAVTRAVAEWLDEVIVTAPHFEEKDAPLPHGAKYQRLRELVGSGQVSLQHRLSMPALEEIARQIGSTPLTVRCYLRRLRKEE